jgi:hypothetical protein
LTRAGYAGVLAEMIRAEGGVNVLEKDVVNVVEGYM